MRTIERNADLFIIPNCGAWYSDFIIPQKELERFCKYNNIDHEIERFIPIWITSDSEEFYTENFADHGAILKDEGEVSHIFDNCDRVSFLPYSLIAKMKEGDTIRVNFGVVTPNKDWQEFISLVDRNNNNEMKEDYELVLNLKASQLKYRYRNNGTFEEVLRQVR